MIDDEVNFGDILDASEEVQTNAKFRPKQRVKPRKTALSSRSAVPIPTVETGDRKVEALNQVSSSKELTSQERASLTCPGSETVDIIAGSQDILDTPLEDASTAPMGPLAGASAAEMISQDGEHNDDPSATDQETLVVSDINASPNTSYGKAIDDIVEFEDIFDSQPKEERVSKFQPKAKLLKETAKSRKTNQKMEASTVDVVTQNEKGNNVQTRLHDDHVQDPKRHESVQIPDSEGLLATDNNEVGSLANLDIVLEESVQEETIAKFRPKLRPKPGKASSKVAGTNKNVDAVAPVVGVCADNNDTLTKSKDQETTTGPATWLPEAAHATVDLDTRNELINPPIDGTQLMVSEAPAVPTFKSQSTVGREKGKPKSVSFSLSDASIGVATPTDTSSKTGNIGDSCDKLTDDSLCNSSQQMAEKDHEGEPVDHDIEQQPKSDAGGIASSMKLRSRKKLQKVGTPNHTVDDCFDEDRVEPSLVEEDNDSGDDYTTGTKRKVRKKSRDGVKESQQQKVKDKSVVSSRGRKRTLKDESAEKPEKKLTHRIRHGRTKEVKTLLETPLEEIDPMKLSAAHLRLLQEARERVNPKEIPSGSSSNRSSFQLDDMDDLDFRDEETRSFDIERTENHVQNATKLNYQSYMNKPTRGKWSKSDTDMFYQGLRQFGSDFAMIQQLFPDKTRHQVRQKFKSEEKKNPLLVHDAIIHRSGDNLYFKKVIKQLNIEDVVLPEINNKHKQDGASSERGPVNENVLDDFTNEEEDDSNWLNEEPDIQMPDVQEEHVSGNVGDVDDLGDVFDWY